MQFHAIPWNLGLQVDVSSFERWHPHVPRGSMMRLTLHCLNWLQTSNQTHNTWLLNHPCGLSSPFFDRLVEQKWVRILALRSVTSWIYLISSILQYWHIIGSMPWSAWIRYCVFWGAWICWVNWYRCSEYGSWDTVIWLHAIHDWQETNYNQVAPIHMSSLIWFSFPLHRCCAPQLGFNVHSRTSAVHPQSISVKLVVYVGVFLSYKTHLWNGSLLGICPIFLYIV